MIPDDTREHLVAIQNQMETILRENYALRMQVNQLQKELCQYRLNENPQTISDAPVIGGILAGSKTINIKRLLIPKSSTEDKSKKQLIARARGIPVTNPHAEERNYRAVVRDKAERGAMEGFECSQCECFYRTTGEHLPNLCNKSSKHKYFKPPPATPAGFWDPWAFDSDAHA